ncbi:Uncharacterised protein [Haemophilus aegyptius]|uniref:Uncharacterized protein n=1 Tax=Haemophilus aegyptius TaxID=197575 RepID=A0ABY1VSD5_HAEAE|nr:Uncharacterised protein [Haemophilus aegyptius]VEH52115.1 Uncharacterised protein [Haemophilus aegyptius]
MLFTIGIETPANEKDRSHFLAVASQKELRQ